MKRKKLHVDVSDVILIAFFLILMLGLALTTPKILTFSNLMRVLQQMAELGIASLGILLVILTGGFDMTSSAMIGMSSVFIGVLYRSGLNIWVAVVLSLILATGAGTINGYLVGVLDIAPMLVTLGTMTLYEGVALALSEGDAISGFPDEFFTIGQKYVFGVPVQALLLLALAVIVSCALNRRPWGRQVYMCGSNAVGARFSGIDVARVIISVYAISALMSGISGVVITSRLATARADAGASYMFEGVAAVMLGGADLAGGNGKVSTTILGVLIFAVLSNGLNLNKVSSLVHQMVVGLVLIIVLLMRFAYVQHSKNASAKIVGNN